MLKAERIFYITNQRNGKIEWYFKAREGDVGPYKSAEQAQSVLKEYIAECIEQGNSGGRNPKDTKPSFNFKGKYIWC